MRYGCSGRIARVDLAKRSYEIEEWDESIARMYLGGSGAATRILLERYPLDASALGPDAPLMLMAGLLTGTMVPTASKCSVCGRSPLTGLWTESTVGGHWPAKFKATGYDGLIITGASEAPVYLLIEEGSVAFGDASDLWGKDTYETSEVLKGRLGEDVIVAAIGPAGENLVNISSIMMGGHDARAAGRTGLGAVMGSKRLKAIAVRGKSRPAVKDASKVQATTRSILETLKKATQMLRDYGTAGAVRAVELTGDLPIRNWAQGSWPEGAAATCGQKIAETILEGHYSCYSCPIRCGKLVRIEAGPYKGTVAHGPEYETAAGFGAMCLNDDLNLLAAANDMCNRYGLDTISTANAVAFAMEAYERGIITREDTGGIEARFGAGTAMLDLVRKIAYKEDIGEVLGQGTKKAAEILGKNSIEFSVHTKGLEYAFHDPRAYTSMAPNYATANRGACHLEALTYFVENKAFPGRFLGLPDEWEPHGTERKAELCVAMQNFMSVFNPLGLCKFLMRGHAGPDVIADWVNGVTGWDLTGSELMRIGERLFNFHRMANVALGISRKDDTLPPRLMVHDRRTGGAAGSLPHIGKMLSEYYALRGWSEEGIPTRERLIDLGLIPETDGLFKVA
ncbi:MAG TPA: aldehyde ferredoxin oxidoreductase family protein [Clostridia bacterium]|nr:aldehyde ferredoxin oxidoreductase family protein [Clostridia bacterium]